MSGTAVHNLERVARGGGGLPARDAAVSLAEVIVRSIYAAVRTWQQRYELRRHLAELDDHLLRDIGLTRAQAAAEAAKPFWRA